MALTLVHKVKTRFSIAVSTISLLTLLILPVFDAHALPQYFVNETVLSGFTKPVGVAFSESGKMFVWEQCGKVYWIDGQQTHLILDISDEVLCFNDQGLLGFALDPHFESNGHFYLFYAVDYAYLAANAPFGNPQSTNLNFTHDVFSDTIGRIVRYTMLVPFTNEPVVSYTMPRSNGLAIRGTTPLPDESIVDTNSWVILLGHWDANANPPHDGLIMASSSHGAGTLAFGTDGTLLASAGDGGCWQLCAGGLPDVGQGGCPCSDNTADAKGITAGAQDVGAFRAQLINSHNGKILRMDVRNIDPVLGAPGVSSNPFYNSAEPYSPKSKVWAYGFRNPYRFSVRPGSGSTNPDHGRPGVLYIGNVGMNSWEELEIVRRSGENHGWPLYEGLTAASLFSPPFVRVQNLDAPNPLFNVNGCSQEYFYFDELLAQSSLNSIQFPNSCDTNQDIANYPTAMHARAALDYRNARVFPTDVRTRIPTFNGSGDATETVLEDASPPLQRNSFFGASVLGGAFYTGNVFPCKFRNSYFFSDTRNGWIKSASVNGDDNFVQIFDFLDQSAPFSLSPVSIANGPDGALYYVKYSGTVNRIRYTQGPTACLQKPELL